MGSAYEVMGQSTLVKAGVVPGGSAHFTDADLEPEVGTVDVTWSKSVSFRLS